MYSGTNTFFRSLQIQKPFLAKRLAFCTDRSPCAGIDRWSSVFGITEIEGGLPHSEIRGSKVVRTSPRLIAAYHVLHRLSAPRHPPDTLTTLDRSHYRCPPFEIPSAEEVAASGIDPDWTTIERPVCFKHTREYCGQAALAAGVAESCKAPQSTN